MADYPFTTLGPQLGMIDLPGERRLVVADLPGLIEGAASGAGLGHDFLRHVERTSFLLHLLDASPPDGSSPADNYRSIRHELSSFSPLLLEKRELIALNKIDLIAEDEREAFITRMAHELGMPEKATTDGRLRRDRTVGVRELLESCWVEVQQLKRWWTQVGLDRMEKCLDGFESSSLFSQETSCPQGVHHSASSVITLQSGRSSRLVPGISASWSITTISRISMLRHRPFRNPSEPGLTLREALLGS